AVVQVEGGGLAAQRAGWCGAEQCLVVLPPPYVLAVGLHVTGSPAAARRGTVGEEELRFLDGGHEQLGMPRQGRMPRRCARLGRTDHQEIRQGHGGDLLTAVEIS